METTPPFERPGWITIDHAVCFIAEHGCPDEFRKDKAGTQKNVREIVHYAFKQRQLPGSDSIRRTITGRLPRSALLKVGPFFTWAATKWPLLHQQKVIPIPPNEWGGRWVMPMPGITGEVNETPSNITEAQKQLDRARAENFRLRQEAQQLREQDTLQKNRIEVFVSKAVELSTMQSKKGKRGGRPKK